MSLHPTLVQYIQEATCVVLDRHEIILIPSQIGVDRYEETRRCDRYLVSWEGGPNGSIRAIFVGDERGGTLELGHVKTRRWEQRFDTTDTFRGTDHLGKPQLVER